MKTIETLSFNVKCKPRFVSTHVSAALVYFFKMPFLWAFKITLEPVNNGR